MLGRAKRVHIDKETTTIIDGAGEKKDIEARIAQIKAQIDETTFNYDREKLQERLAKLAGFRRRARASRGAASLQYRSRRSCCPQFRQGANFYADACGFCRRLDHLSGGRIANQGSRLSSRHFAQRHLQKSRQSELTDAARMH
jgi:hypothetical protein